MEHYIAAAVFIFTTAIVSAGILISVQLRTVYKTDFLSTLIYFQVFWFTFGFYVFWGKVLIILVLKNLAEPSLIRIITNLTVYLGAPFLIFAGLMFLRFTREIAGKKNTGWFVTIFLLANIVIFPVIAILTDKTGLIEKTGLVKNVFVAFYLLYTITGLIFLLSGKKKQQQLKSADIGNLSTGLAIIMIIQSITIIMMYDRNIWFTLVFIFVFYLLGVFIPLYLKYAADLSALLVKDKPGITFENFCDRFEISKREKEIIYEICEGLSNQQIADKLFISLQTVKDHTHRIYFKTGCNSRTQLIRMVNENQ